MCAHLLTLSLTVHCTLKLLLTGRENSENKAVKGYN